MMLNTWIVSKTSGSTSRQTESVKHIRRLFKVVARTLANHPDPFAVLVQQDGNRHERTGEEREECARPADPEVAICGPGEERECRAEHRTDKVVSG